jgi:hypothetical protein
LLPGPPPASADTAGTLAANALTTISAMRIRLILPLCLDALHFPPSARRRISAGEHDQTTMSRTKVPVK